MHTVLYRKLRPKKFEQVIGQDHIVTTLKNQITQQRIAHAYLFCGTRGTGKTSCAKIFSRVVNCENPIDGEPCNTCSKCIDILDERTFDIVEIDAASNNGVDNIREINDSVKYPPASNKYKVYIIDEVHMLSNGAFNALLKTLEEPPKYVIFILATTDFQKIPATIISRCQRYNFNRILMTEMKDTLIEYSSIENIKIDDDALDFICTIADGAMRDALSLLEQLTSFIEDRITLEKTLNILGAVDTQCLFDMVECFRNFDTITSLKIINKISTEGRDIKQFISSLIKYLRDLLIIKYTSEADENKIQQANNLEADIIIIYINKLSELLNNIKHSNNDKIALEIFCIKICNPNSNESSETIERLLERITRLEQGLPAPQIPAVNFPIEPKTEKVESPRVKPEKVEATIQPQTIAKTEPVSPIVVKTTTIEQQIQVKPEQYIYENNVEQKLSDEKIVESESNENFISLFDRLKQDISIGSLATLKNTTVAKVDGNTLHIKCNAGSKFLLEKKSELIAEELRKRAGTYVDIKFVSDNDDYVIDGQLGLFGIPEAEPVTQKVDDTSFMDDLENKINPELIIEFDS